MATILGAGVVGICTARALARAGHRVTVIDRDAEPASGTSWGNAGIIALGHATAWAGPEAPRQITRALLGRDPAVGVRRIDPSLVRWGTAFLRQCTARAAIRNTGRVRRLAQLGRDELRRIEAAEGIAYHQRHDGGFYVYTDAGQWRAERAREAGNPGLTAMEPADLAAADPGLAGFGSDLAGGFLSADDSRGDCAAFTRALARRLERDGVRFVMETEIKGLERAGDRITALRNAGPPIRCEGPVILACGSAVPRLVRPLGLGALICPVKGYSATYPVRDPDRVPARSFVDETSLVGVSTLGDRLRVTARAEFAGHDLSVPDAARARLDAYATTRFGEAIDTGGAVYWAGLRPSTPTGAPYLGRVRGIGNLWINAGHGQLGWTMAAGAGRLLAERIDGRTTAVRDVSQPARWLEGI